MQCVRRGDPLSPYLFLLCTKGLINMFIKAERNGRIQGIRIGNEGFSFTHLLFSDDSVVHGLATLQNLQGIKDILQKYEKTSGQAIHFQKSAMVLSKTVNASFSIVVFDMLGIKVVSNHEKYWDCRIRLVN